MRPDRAIALIQHHFPGAVEVEDPTADVVEVEMWPDRCHCGRHPHTGHPAKPVQRARTVA